MSDPEIEDKVRKCHPHTRTLTVCASNLPQVTRSLVGKATLGRNGGLGGQAEVGGLDVLWRFQEECKQMAQVWGPGCKSWLLPFATAADGKSSSLWGAVSLSVK